MIDSSLPADLEFSHLIMNILAFDTSGPVLSVAVQRDSAAIQEKTHFGSWEHMENLLPFADELLRESQLTINQIDAYILNRGPGSFTGLRIGFATLKGLIAADLKPCFSCDSLDALAERIPAASEKHLAVCLDAFRSKFYIKIFENKNNQWISLSEPAAVEINQALQQIPREALISGDALKRFQKLFETAPDKNFKVAPEELWYPRASSLVRIYKNHPSSAKKLISSDDFLPFYLRQSEPEERRDEKVSPKA